VPGQPLELFLNTTREPTDRLAVRQALIMATDRQAIVQALFQGYSPIAYGPLSSATLYYSPEVEGLYAFDQVQSVALFNTTGLVDSDGDGWRDNGDSPIKLDLVVPPWGQSPEVAQLLELQWESTLHVQVAIHQVASFPMLSDSAANGDYNGIALNFFGLDPSVINAFYQSNSRLNWSHIADANLDQLLAEAQAEMAPERRAALYTRIQNEIMDQALVLPIREYINLNAASPSIQGLHFDAQGWFPYLTDIGLGF
jgi:ABC-type transport system substrate-binding protein